MATLNHLQRKWLSINVTWLAERRHIPIGLLASKTLIDTPTLEKWLDYTQSGGIVLSQDQLSRLAEAVGVQRRSNLYCYSPDDFKARYAGESAPTPVPRKKPGPAKGSHREPRAGAQAGLRVRTLCGPEFAVGHGGIGPWNGKNGKNGKNGRNGTNGANPRGLSDSALRQHLTALIENPLVSFRDAVRLAYKALFVSVTLGPRAGGVNPPAKTGGGADGGADGGTTEPPAV